MAPGGSEIPAARTQDAYCDQGLRFARSPRKIFRARGGPGVPFFALMGVSPSFFVLSRSMPNKSLLVGWRDRWNRSLMQFLNRRVPTAVDVEDLAQETYLRLLRARDLSDVRNPQAYLLRVASHVVLEWRNNLARVELVSSADEELVADETLPEFELDASLSQERLDQALAGMSPLMRAVLLLRLRDERSNQEIAQELALTPRQVRRYLARGYERLHGALEN